MIGPIGPVVERCLVKPMKLQFTLVLLFLAALGVQEAAGQNKVAKIDHEPLDMRFNAVLDLNYMIRKYGSSKADLPKNLDGFEEAVAVARQLNSEFGSWLGGGWPAIDAALTKCKNTSQAMQALAQLPETTTSRQGKAIRVRDAAIRYAKVLNAVEASYLKNVAPQHQTLVAQTNAHLTKIFNPKKLTCFSYLSNSLGLGDIQTSIPVFLVGEAPWPGAFTFWDSTKKGNVVISIEATPGSMLFETLIHETIHALDLENTGTGNVLEEIRTRLKNAGLAENDIAVVQGSHLLVFIQAGETVRRFLDPAHQHYGDVKGLYQYPGLQPLVKVARAVWMDHLDNKISREEAIKQIVDGFLKARKETAP